MLCLGIAEHIVLLYSKNTAMGKQKQVNSQYNFILRYEILCPDCFNQTFDIPWILSSAISVLPL